MVVVGGGLAGAVTALWLQHRGISDVRVLERKPSPGTTPCGEGVSANALTKLAPVFDATPYIDATLEGIRWRFPGSTLHVHQRCHTMARETWIPAMLDAFADRGGTVECGVRVANKQMVEELDAEVVVGCDGPGSVVRSLVPGAHVQLRTGIQFRVGSQATTRRLEFVTNDQFSREYAWWFPRSESHNIGLLAERGGRDDWKRLNAVVEAFGVEGRILKRESYPIAFGGRRFASPGGRYLLNGDAAGLTNPLTKGGIAALLQASPLLADAVASGKPRRYDHALRRHPLTYSGYQRALRLLRRYDNAAWQRLLAAAPGDIYIGGDRPTRTMAVAACMVARRPWLAGTAHVFYYAARKSLRHGW